MTVGTETPLSQDERGALPEALLEQPLMAAPQGGLSCRHYNLYLIFDYEATRAYCGLCTLAAGFQSEVPTKTNLSRTLAENGNPETDPKFLAHLTVMEGLLPPPKNMSLSSYTRARRQYTPPAHGLFPVTSALWEMMGRQPPLARVLVDHLLGLSYQDIMVKYDMDSIYHVHTTMTKAVRLALRFLRHDSTL